MISRDYVLVGSTSRAAVWGSSVGDDEPKLVSTSENQWKHVVLEELILLIWLPSSGGQLRSLSERPALRAVALMSLSSIKDGTVSTSSTVGARIADCWEQKAIALESFGIPEGAASLPKAKYASLTR